MVVLHTGEQGVPLKSSVPNLLGVHHPGSVVLVTIYTPVVGVGGGVVVDYGAVIHGMLHPAVQ
jgi:hypothetical protein